MNKTSYLPILILLIIQCNFTVSFAKKISEEEALRKAQVFLKGKKLLTPNKVRGAASTTNERQNPPYYIFNAKGNGGFVIISGDDRTPEVLGYANEGAFDIETAPANARWLMDYYKKSISSLDTDIQTKTFSKKAPANRSSVAPLVKTKWGQGNRGMAYNKYCPQVDGKKCFVGCVATAMAQIMNYHQWPVSATTAIGAYTTETENIYMPALSPTTFNWNNMTDDDIARLLLYCGQSVQMDYGPTTSYAYAEDAAVSFYEVFGYETGAHYIFRDDFADDDWEELMYNELRNYGPILYRGADPNAGGHIFICDGYDASNGLFSINWGWYGDCDGYFLLSQLKPGDDYSSGQGAVVGVRPPYSATINFVDDKVKALCVANWDTNGDGELSYVEAAAVTDLGTVFKGNTEITHFDELQFFTGLNSIGDDTYSPKAFSDCYNLRSITIPESVTKIGNYAFMYSGLASITIPESVTSIGYVAFQGCISLTSITIPEKVTSIGADAFKSCYGLTSVIVNANNTSYDSRNNCNAIIETATNTLITGCQNTIIPNSVTGIEGEAFMNCKGLTSISIPKSVTKIGENVFGGCDNLTSIVVEAGNPAYDSRDNCNAIIETSTNTLVAGCKASTIPDGVVKIARAAFCDCIGLTSVTIPKSVTHIGAWSFKNCGLTAVSIPQNVISIGEYAFYVCHNLTTVYSYIKTPFAISDDVFGSIGSNNTLYVPNNIKTNYETLSGWKNFKIIEEMGTGGDDMTNFIVNPGFEDGIQSAVDPNNNGGEYGTATGWTAEKKSYGNFTPGPFGSDYDDILTQVLGAPNHCFEAWHCRSFDLWQEIENLPKGMYQLEVQGFVRCEVPTYVRGDELGKDYPSPVYLYLNQATSRFPSVYSECPADLGHTMVQVEDWYQEVINGKPYPNSMGSAAQCFSWGMYKTTAYGLIAKEGDKFRIGVKMNAHQDWWCIFDNFKLTYHQPTVEVVKPVLEEELSKYDLSLLIGSDFYEQASKVIDDAKTALASNNGEQMFNALVAVYDMSESYLDALQSKEERTFLYSHNLDGTNYSLYCQNNYNDVRYNADGTAYFRTALTLDVTKDGTTNTYTVDDGPYISDIATSQKPCMAINTQTRQLFIFDNSSDGYSYALDGYCYVTSLDNISFKKETVFTEANWGWWPKFAVSEGGQLTLTHFSYAGYYAMTSTRNSNGSWTTDYANDISPDDYKVQNESKPNVLVFNAPSNSSYIAFADAKVKAICVENWDTNGDHELSEDEAAAVTDLGEVFRENEEITSFNELKYFTGLTKISEAAFFGDYALRSVELPAGLTSIEHAAFGICSSLTSIFIPKNVTSINGTSFRDCTSLVDITVDGENPVYESPRGCNAIINKNTKTLVTGCKVTVVPDGVEIIGPSAFYGQYSIKELVLPASVKQIGYDSYDGCGFETLVIPNTVERIDYAAFWNCHSLATIKLPAKTPMLSSEICSNCMKLKEIISLNPNPTAISDDVFIVDFDGTMPDATLYVPNGSKAKYEATEGWKRFTKIVEADLMDPIEKGEKVDFEDVGSGTDLAGNIVDDVFINIPVGEGSYDADDKCLVVTKVSNDATVNTLVDKDPMSDEVKKGISGVIFKVPAGEGNVKVEAESTGGMTLKVKIGKVAPVEIALTGKASMKFPYNVSEPTYVYIYAGQSAAARGIQKTSTAGSLKLYSVAVVRATGVGDLNSDSEIDVTDVVELIDMVLAGSTDPSGDINGDGEVDVTDVVELIDMVLAGE